MGLRTPAQSCNLHHTKGFRFLSVQKFPIVAGKSQGIVSQPTKKLSEIVNFSVRRCGGLQYSGYSVPASGSPIPGLNLGPEPHGGAAGRTVNTVHGKDQLLKTI